jgi:hypothetical protein
MKKNVNMSSINDVIKYLIENNISKNEWYVEPFANDCSVLSTIRHSKKVACDKNKHVIKMWRCIQGAKLNGLNEKEFNEYYYKKVNGVPLKDILFFGAALDVCTSQIKNFKDLKNTIFINHNYDKLIFTEKSFVYCSIFHDNTRDFWAWCRNVVKNNHKVMVSGFNAPKDFVCIYEVDGEGIYIHESQIPFFNF